MRIYEDDNGVAINAFDTWPDSSDGKGHTYQVLSGDRMHMLHFQRGGVADKGVNGLTNEALPAILIDRTRHLDRKFSSPENFAAIRAMEYAKECFELRTKLRTERGVEGREVS